MQTDTFEPPRRDTKIAMDIEVEQATRSAAEELSQVFNGLSESVAEQPDCGDLYQFLRDVSGFLARNDPPQ